LIDINAEIIKIVKEKGAEAKHY